MEKANIKIGVVSDVVCPWCYIGKRRLESAMELASEAYHFETEYFPFELNPHIPEEGIAYRDYVLRKFGSEAKFHELNNHVTRVAAGEGLDFHPELQRISPNTRNAHRVIMLARESGRQADVAEAFFRAYFVEGTDLSDVENLIGIAERCGMESGAVGELLYSNIGKLEIEMAEKEMHDLGITAVPLFIINDRLAISGAQPVQAFVEAFEEAVMLDKRAELAH
jgi:predicted DsbA family dithiol-disulfide isomerase